MLTDQVVYNPADRMESETKIIRGYQIMKGSALKLGLLDANSSTDEVNEAVSSLQDAIGTERVGGTNMISITATASEPKKAMDMSGLLTLTRKRRGLICGFGGKSWILIKIMSMY